MHIPDGFLDIYIASITYLITVVFLVYSFFRARKSLSDDSVPLIGVLAATIFVAQLIDWPIPGGTTAHFVGSGLVVIMAGFEVGVIVMFIVLFFQAIFFQDGGLTTLGANVLNMGIIGCGVGLIVFKIYLKIFGRDKIFLASFLAGWSSVTVAAIACGFEIGLSTNFAYGVSIAVPVMGISHALLGILEGLITAIIVDYLFRVRPGIILSMRGD